MSGVPFGRTELSIRASCKKLSTLSSREGSVGLGIQRIPEKFDFHDFVWTCLYKQNLKFVDRHGWILEFRAENDTKCSA